MIGIIEGIRSVTELEARFGTEAACQAALASWRWPTGFQCPTPTCQGRSARYLEERRTWYCTRCARQVSVTAGTIFARTKKPLPLWFKSIWLFMRYSQHQGESEGVEIMTAQRLMDDLKLTRYQTAWSWMQRIRELVVQLRLERSTGVLFQAALRRALKAKGTRGKRAWGSPVPASIRRQSKRKWYQTVLAQLRCALLHGKATPFRNALSAWLEGLKRPPVSRKHFGRWLAEGVMRCWQGCKVTRSWPLPEKHASLSYWHLIFRTDASTRLRPAFGG